MITVQAARTGVVHVYAKRCAHPKGVASGRLRRPRWQQEVRISVPTKAVVSIHHSVWTIAATRGTTRLARRVWHGGRHQQEVCAQRQNQENIMRRGRRQQEGRDLLPARQVWNGERRQHEVCPHPLYAVDDGGNRGEYCSNHAKPGMVFMMRSGMQRCAHRGCSTRPSYGVDGRKKAKYCAKHAKPGMMNVRFDSRRSSVTGSPGVEIGPSGEGVVSSAPRANATAKRKKPIPPPRLCRLSDVSNGREGASRMKRARRSAEFHLWLCRS